MFMVSLLVTYHLAEFLGDSSTVEFPWDNPPATISTDIELYINFDNAYFWIFGNTNATIVARLQVTSIYSGHPIPASNIIVPQVTLTNPNTGTEGSSPSEGSSLELTLKNTTAGLEYCYDALQDTNHTLYRVQANIHSPHMYSQLGKHNFTIRLTFYSPESLQLNNDLQYRTDTYSLIVEITAGSMLNEIIYFLPKLNMLLTLSPIR